jgi:hypothetical protein
MIGISLFFLFIIQRKAATAITPTLPGMPVAPVAPGTLTAPKAKRRTVIGEK